jgi:hypothetical protein
MSGFIVGEDASEELLALKKSLRILEYTGHSPPQILDRGPKLMQNTEAPE